MISKSKARKTRKRRPGLRISVRHCGGSHLLVATAMSAMTVVMVESNRLVEFPSGVMCAWNDLPHPAQFAVIFLVSELYPRCNATSCGTDAMLALLIGVHRIFGKLDNVAYARLSRAVTAWMNERRHAHQG
ncbi:unnamed protein product [Ectocarpus sp. 4 AP-2014]